MNNIFQVFLELNHDEPLLCAMAGMFSAIFRGKKFAFENLLRGSGNTALSPPIRFVDYQWNLLCFDSFNKGKNSTGQVESNCIFPQAMLAERVYSFFQKGKFLSLTFNNQTPITHSFLYTMAADTVGPQPRFAALSELVYILG